MRQRPAHLPPVKQGKRECPTTSENGSPCPAAKKKGQQDASATSATREPASHTARSRGSGPIRSGMNPKTTTGGFVRQALHCDKRPASKEHTATKSRPGKGPTATRGCPLTDSPLLLSGLFPAGSLSPYVLSRPAFCRSVALVGRNLRSLSWDSCRIGSARYLGSVPCGMRALLSPKSRRHPVALSFWLLGMDFRFPTLSGTPFCPV